VAAVKSVLVRVAPVKSAPLRLAPAKLALVRSAWRKMAGRKPTVFSRYSLCLAAARVENASLVMR